MTKQNSPQMTEAQALDTIQSLDSYYRECKEVGQGINSKEVVQMSNAMRTLVKARMGAALDIMDMVSSDTSRGILQRVVAEEYPGLREFFAPRE
jgi:hypothetical protein